MKKILFASTALVAASFASATLASEPLSATVRGYAHVGLIYQDNGSDPEVGILNDGEIHFRFRGVSDNGLTFDGEVELESFTTADQIDEYWARVSGSWGSIKIGADDTASEDHERGVFYAPGAHAGYFDGFQSIMFSSNAGDVPSIRYRTPTFSGFAASVDWAPNSTADGCTVAGVPASICNNAQQITFGNSQQRWSVGASWDGEFDGFNIGIGAGYLDGDLFARGRYHVGAAVGIGDFSIGVHYDSAGAGSFAATDNSALAVGATYDTGPWTFGGGVAIALDGPDQLNWGVWASYSIMPGATATLGYEGNDRNVGFNTTVQAYLTLSF